MCNKVVHSARRSASATLRRAAIVAVAGLFPLTATLFTASASSAATGSVAFNGATGSNGSYAATVTFSATSSDNTYTAVAYDTASSTATFTYTATAGSAGCAIVSPNSGAVTFTSPGTCVITATTTSTDKDQGQGSGDGNATGATGTLTLTVLPTPQTITVSNSPPSSPLVGSTYAVSATATSGLVVQLSVDASSTSGCTIDTSTGNQTPLVTSGVVTLSPPVGTCVIDANQGGNADYAPAPQVQQVVTDVLAPQTISVAGPNPTNVEYGATSTYQIQATDSSGATIDYATSSPTCAVNAAGLISGLGVGTCVVTLSAPATSSFSAASPVTFTLSVQAPPPPPPVVVTPPVVTPPPPPPPVVTPPVVTPPPPVVIRVSPSKPVHKPRPHLPRAKSVAIKPFAEASHTLTKPLLAQVWRLALSIKRQHYTTVTLTGYTDNVFTPAMDALVIRERSLAVSRQLQFDLGRLKVRWVTITIAPGVTIQLVTLNTTPSSRALNRRVVATLTA